MKKKIFIVANWKMNLNISNSSKLLTQVQKSIKKDNNNVEIIICPQFLLMSKISKFFTLKTKLIMGAQDIHHSYSGAFTGDTSIELVKSLGCKYSIIGHSERRQYHHETNMIIKKKIELLEQFKIIPILCVGETDEERKKKKHFNIITKQIVEVIPRNIKKILIAYEPIWSIGTGLIPNNRHIEEITNFICNLLKEKRSDIKNVFLLYGGSMNSKNFSTIMKVNNVNGGLIGGASLKANELSKIIGKAYLD